MNEEYILIPWPDVQDLMGKEWFRKECYLCQSFEDQEHFDSAYFVPKSRVNEYDDNLKGDNNDNV